MDRFNALGRGLQTMLVAGVLLLLVMFFPWQDFGPEVVEFNGWEGFAGVILGLLTILAVAWVVLKLVAVEIPLPISDALVTAIIGGLVVLFGAIKFLSVIDDEATLWAFIGTILALAVGLGAWLTIQAAGGVDALKSEVANIQSSSFGDAPAATSEPPPPAPPETTPEASSAPPPVEQAPPAEPEPATEPEEPQERQP
jgi:hypothetical protein